MVYGVDLYRRHMGLGMSGVGVIDHILLGVLLLSA